MVEAAATHRGPNIGGIRKDRGLGFQPMKLNDSVNHGLEAHATSVAYKKIVIVPTPGGKLTSADVRYDSIRGRIESAWGRRGQLTTLRMTLLMLALAKIGRNHVAYRLIHNDTFPSWGFSIKHGATSIRERWDGWMRENGFSDPGVNGFAPYGFGAVRAAGATGGNLAVLKSARELAGRNISLRFFFRRANICAVTAGA